MPKGFLDRERFNWGYHDGADVVKRGADTRDRNYGFGPSIKIRAPWEVIEKHFDKMFAHGWTAGYYDAKEGRYTGSSNDAWKRFQEWNKHQRKTYV